MSVRRRSAAPIEETPKTWVQVLFFPLSLIALALMAAMLLIYLGSTWMLVPPEEPHEVLAQPPPRPVFHPRYDLSAPIDPPQDAEQGPSGGIVIEK
jgi:hypothetical protein